MMSYIAEGFLCINKKTNDLVSEKINESPRNGHKYSKNRKKHRKQHKHSTRVKSLLARHFKDS